MGSRSRKRKRSAGAAPAKPVAAKPATAPPAAEGGETLKRGYARGRARDEAARQSLEPLEPGERPTAVTVAAIVAALLAVVNVGAGLLVSDVQPSQVTVAVLQGLVLLVAAGGMWKAKYWAVLGFEALLAFQILLLSLAVLVAENLIYAAGSVIAIGLLGTLFFKLIRAMARLQMPERPRR